MSNNFPATPEQMQDEAIRNQFWALRGYGILFGNMVFKDTVSLVFCLMHLFANLRFIKAIDHVLTALEQALSILLRGSFFWLLANLGLCLFNLAIYGGRERRYSDFLNAYVNTLYNQAALAPQ